MSPGASTIGGDQSVEDLRRELAEAREQLASTAAILTAISNSPTDPYRVFAEIAASAARLCDAYDATIFQVDGDVLRLVGHSGPIPSLRTLPLSRGFSAGCAVLERRTVHVADIQAEAGSYPEGSDRARRIGFHTLLNVPLVRASAVIGVIALRRTEARLFSDKQIALLETFANQAVIAIENARLFEAELARTSELTKRTRELTDALEYQTATSDVLAVISRSKFDLQPVLNIIAQTASRLCAADDVIIFLKEGGDLRAAAHHGSIAWDLTLRMAIGRGWIPGRTVVDRQPIHVHNITTAGDEFPLGREIAGRYGVRTMLGVPLLRDDKAIGCLVLRRTIVQPFTDKQIALLQTFADQAVIAIENTRLFEEEQASKRELTIALEQQTATSEVLGVISSSPGELGPVFEALLENAVRICGAKFGNLWLREGSSFRIASTYGAPPEYREFFQLEPVVEPHPESGLGLILSTKRPIHIEDITAPGFKDKMRRATAELAKARSLVGIPMLKHNEVVGGIAIYRQEVRPFTDKQVDLLTSFARQAVIAIENARLLNELRESLQQQTATADVLKVISRSAFDLQAVLQALVESAARLCDADNGTITRQIDSVFYRA